MKAVFVFNVKTKTLTSFTYAEPGPLPPFIEPANPEEPKDCNPQKPGRKKRRPRTKPN